MKTGNNICLLKRAKGLEKLYSKPWSLFNNPSKWLRKDRLKNRSLKD
jgi:hypothetical protein